MSKRLAKSYTRLVLEKRIVFDAAAVQTATEISDVVDSAETDALVADLGSTQDNTESEILFDILTAPAVQADFNRSVLIVDSRVEDLESLLVDLAPNTDVFVLDANQDGVEQINSILANYNSLSSLQILSHADDASLILGNTVLNNNNIDSYADTLSSWGNALSNSGDILLFGCDVANGADGLAFIQSLADYTRADVAASIDDTGAGSQGGDWDLEATTGSIEADSVLSEQAIADYDGLLATITFDGGAGTVFWDDAANWSGDSIPAVGDDVILNGVTVTVRDAQLINTLSLTNGASLTVNATSSLSLTNGGSIDATSSLDGTFQLDGGLFNNDGIIRISAGSIDLANGANFVNDTNSQIYVNASSGFVISDTTGTAGMFTNNGLVATNSNSTPAIIDANFVNNSLIILGRNATGGLVFQGTFDSSNGQIKGIGALDLSAAVGSGIGTIDPGFGATPIGQLNVVGDVVLNPNSLLKIDLDNTMPDSDTIMVSGNVTLDGTLNINVINGFAPIVGQTFTIISSVSNFIDNGLNITATRGYQFTSNVVNNGTELQIVTIAIPAVAANDNLITNEDTPLTITEADLLANDTDIVSIFSVTQPPNGSLVLNEQTGNYIYTPKANFNGTDSFTYTAVDAQLSRYTATVNITVNSVADNVTWTNATGDNRWETAGNWDLGFSPMNGDNAIIPDQQGSIIFSSGTVTLNSLTSSENDFQITGGSLLLGDDGLDTSSFSSGSRVFLSGGELGGLGTTNLNGDLTFSGGLISGDVNIGSASTLLFSNLFRNSDLTGTLNNSGTIEFSANGSRLLGGTINNTSAGTIDFSSNLVVTVDSGNSSILNKGLIVKSAGTGESRFNVIAGSALNFSGSGIFDAGAGIIAIDGDANYAADFTASGNMGSSAIRLNSGLHTFATGSSFANGDFIFRGGTIAGELSIESDAKLTFNDLFRSSVLTGTLNNVGTIEFAANGSRINGGTINNIGTIDFTANLTVTNASGTATIVNNGSIIKTGGGGESLLQVVGGGSGFNFSGNGVFDSRIGVISIEGDTNYAADFTASGGTGSTAFRIGSGIHNFSVGSSLNNGDFIFRGGEISGELSIGNTALLLFNDLFRNSDVTGTLNNAGTIEFSANGSRLLGATINNTGAIDFSSDLTVTVNTGTTTIINNGFITKSFGTGDSLFNILAGSAIDFSGNGVFDAQTGSLSLEGDANYAANFSATGGSGASALRISSGTHSFGVGSSFNNGVFVFRGGEIAGDLTVANDARLIFNDLFRNSDLTGTLNNSGTVEFASNASRLLGATINNTGNIDFSSDLTVTVDTGTTAIANNGSITKSAGGGDSRFNILAGSAIDFSGNGVFDAQTGSLSLEGDANYASSFSATGGSGASALRISSGTHSFGVGSSFNNGVFVFRGGEIAGDLTIANDASLIFNDLFRNSDLTGTLNNSGTVEFASNASRLLGGTLNNQLGGVVEFSADLTITANLDPVLGTRNPSIVNNGSFVKTGGMGDSLFNVIAGSAINFSGAGSYDGGLGVLSIEGDVNYDATFTASGGMGANALRFSSGTHTFTTGSSLNNGDFIFRGGEIAGELDINNGASLVFNDLFRNSDLTGTLNNSGTVEFATNASRILGGTLNNQLTGIVDFSANLTLTFNADPVLGTRAASIINNGTFIKSAGGGDTLLNSTGGLALNFAGDGIFNVQSGSLSLNGNIDYAANFSASGMAGGNSLRITGGIQSFGANSSFNNGTFEFRGGEIAGDLTVATDATLNVTNAFSFSDISGSVTNAGVLNFVDNNIRLFGATISNSGTINVSSSISDIRNTTIINTGTIDFTNDSDLRNTSGVLTLSNDGSIIKTGGTGDSQILVAGGSGFAISGNGIIDARMGFISLLGSTTYTNNFTVTGGTGANSLRISSGVHTFGAGSSFNSGKFTFSGGEIAGDLTIAADASLDVTNNSSFSDFSGTLVNNGALSVIGNNTRFFGTTITNNGTFTISALISDARNTTINNAGTIDFTNDSDLRNTSGILTISNDGSIIKTGGTGDSQFLVAGGSGFAISGNGIIDARMGFISLSGNTTYTDGFSVTGGTGPNSLRILSGVQTFGVGSSFNSGTFTFSGGEIAGDLTLEADVTLDVTNNSAFSDFTGTLNNTGTLNVVGTNTRFFNATVTNSGTFTISANLSDIRNTTFNNTGMIDFTNDSDFVNTSGVVSVINNGSIIKSAGSGDTQFRVGGGMNFIFSGNGIIDAQAGFISLVGTSTYANNFTVTGGSGPNTLRFSSGIQTFGAGSSLNNGTFTFSGGEIAGDLTLAADATLTVTNNSSFSDFTGTLNNAGTVQITSDNTRILGGTFNNQQGGVLEFTNDSDITTNATATITNAGTILKSAGTGLSFISNLATFTNNGGIIDAQTGTLQLPASITSTGYILQGNGTIDLNGTTAPIAEIRPGTSPGILTVTGNIDLDPTTSLTSEIGGSLVGIDYDQLQLTGVINFNGATIDISFLNGFEAQLSEGQIFTLATYASSIGSIQSLALNATNLPQAINLRLIDTGTALQLAVGVNTAPTASDDTFLFNASAAEQGVLLDVLINDSDLDGDFFTIDTFNQPANGTVILLDGVLIYTSDAGFSGSDSFTYTIVDTGGLVSTATVDLFIIGNTDPVAVDDDFAVVAETSTLLGVLNNDFDPDEDNLTIFDFTQPVNGTVILEQGGDFSYTSNAGFSGVDTFTYSIDDGNGGVDTATVSVTVLPMEAVSVRGDGNQTTDVLPGVLVTFTQGTNGTVIDNGDGTFTYQPDQGFRGTDSFTVTTTIGNNSVDQVVSVNIQDAFNQFWTGAGADNDFFNPENWNTGLAPASGDDITIPDGTDIINFANGNNVTLNSLTLSDTLIVSNGAITVAGTTTILNTGVLDIATGQTFAVTGADFVNNGTIFGKGTLDVTLATSFINNGILSPGNSPGTLTINGDFTQTSSGTIVLEIAGLTPGTQYDQLIVNGTATLNGTVSIVLLNGFILPANGNFQLISATSILGSPIINTPAGVTFDLFTGNTTSTPLGGFTGTGTFTFGPTSTGTGGYISISGPSYTYDPIQVARSGSTVNPIVYRTVDDSEWTGVIDDLSVALVDEGATNDELVAEFERLLESDPTAAGETLSEYELRLEQQLELSISQFSKEQLAVLDILLQTPDTLSCR